MISEVVRHPLGAVLRDALNVAARLEQIARSLRGGSPTEAVRAAAQ